MQCVFSRPNILFASRFMKDSLPVNADAPKTPPPSEFPDRFSLIDFFLILSFGKGATVHKLLVLSSDQLRRAGFDSIAPRSFQHLKARLVVATEAFQGRNNSPEDYLVLDEATLTGKGYLDLITRFNDSGDDAAKVRYARAFVSVAKAMATYSVGKDERDQMVPQQLRLASQMEDSDVLSMVLLQWTQLMPKSSTELTSLAARNILEKLEMTCNTTAHRMSEEQFRASESSFRGKVESIFRGMLDSRLQ